MKHLILYTLIILAIFSLHSQESVIGLKNKKVTSKVSSKIDYRSGVIRNDYIIPKSIYIGDLADFKSINLNQNNILGIIDNFFNSFSDARGIENISDSFRFIFQTLFKESVLDKELKSWSIGSLVIDGSSAYSKVELNFKDEMQIGYIYLEKESKWVISDLQLNIEEKGYYDPSSIN